jgi:ABC-type oligopeptide transport system ATPase subunit
MIIALNGYSGSGKDTVGKIIQDLLQKEDDTSMGFPSWEIKKFADKVTQCFKLITGTNYHKLSREEKEKCRDQYIEFAEKQKEIFGENVWINSLFCYQELQNPNWIISDLRFPNEYQVVKDREGIVVKINRFNKEHFNDVANGREAVLHSSETSLDNHNFDYVINNDSDIPHLIEEVRKMLKIFNII